MKTIRLMMLMVGLSIVCVGCHGIIYNRLSRTDREMIPYHIGDTVRFVDERGERVTVVATEEERSWDITSEEFTELQVERLTVRLKSDTGNHYILVFVAGHEANDDTRHMEVWTNQAGADLRYSSGGELVNYYNSIVYDSVVIGGRVYHNVAWGNGRSPVGYNEGYYSKTHGLLQMQTDGKTVFTLDTVIFAGAR